VCHICIVSEELLAAAFSPHLLSRAPQVHTSGLLNIIGAPHLARDSTYVATYTHTQVPPTMLQGDITTAKCYKAV
jgi:hypothetical protein